MGSVLADNLHGPRSTGIAGASRPAWWIVVGCGAVAAAVTLWTTGRAGKARAARAAQLILEAEEERALTHA